MDEMYGLHSSADYSDKALMMSPENLMMAAAADYSSYSSFMSSNDHYDRINMFVGGGGGSDKGGAASAGGFPCSAISEAASMTPQEIRRVSRRCGSGAEHQGGDDEEEEEEEEDEDACSIIKAKIASHPSYPKLLHAYIDCQKVGAPPEIASILDELIRENGGFVKEVANTTCLGADPELDEFMVCSLHF